MTTVDGFLVGMHSCSQGIGECQNDLTLVDLTKHHDAREFRLRITRNGRVEEEDTYHRGQNTALLDGMMSIIRMLLPMLVATSL